MKADRKKLTHNVLAEGEVTGHCHRASDGVVLYEVDGTEISIEAVNAWRLAHEEHHVIEAPVHTHTGAPTANYVRRIVKEMDHAAEAVKNIQD